MGTQPNIAFVVVAAHGGFLDRAVHPFDLTIRPYIIWLRQTVIDIVAGAGHVDGIGSEDFLALDHRLDLGDAPACASGHCEVNAVGGENGVDLVGHQFDQLAQEVGRNTSGGAFMQFGEGELAYSVDGYEHVELALLGPDFGDVDMEVADRIGLELLARLGAFDAWQAADVMALKQPMQTGTGEMSDRGLERIEAIIELQQRMPAEGDDQRFLFL